jgi:hypothetical protein
MASCYRLAAVNLTSSSSASNGQSKTAYFITNDINSLKLALDRFVGGHRGDRALYKLQLHSVWLHA